MIRNSAINLLLKIGLAISSLVFAIVSFVRSNEILFYYPQFIISILGDAVTLIFGSIMSVVLAIWILSQKQKFAAVFTYMTLIGIGMIFNMGSLVFLAITWPLFCIAGALSLRYYPRIRVIVSGKNGDEKMKIVPIDQSVNTQITDQSNAIESTEISNPANITELSNVNTFAKNSKSPIADSQNVYKNKNEQKTNKKSKGDHENISTDEYKNKNNTIDELNKTALYPNTTPFIEEMLHSDEDHRYTPLAEVSNIFDHTISQTEDRNEEIIIYNTSQQHPMEKKEKNEFIAEELYPNPLSQESTLSNISILNSDISDFNVSVSDAPISQIPKNNISNFEDSSFSTLKPDVHMPKTKRTYKKRISKEYISDTKLKNKKIKQPVIKKRLISLSNNVDTPKSKITRSKLVSSKQGKTRKSTLRSKI